MALGNLGGYRVSGLLEELAALLLNLGSGWLRRRVGGGRPELRVLRKKFYVPFEG